MAKIKSYTDIEQSKVLAKILPLESANYTRMGKNNDNILTRPYLESCSSELNEWLGKENLFPCWSLAALLSVLPTLDDRNANFCKDIRYDKWHVYYHSTATLSIIDTERYDNPIDACYEMIQKLHELKIL